jgi:hypothetical protein
VTIFDQKGENKEQGFRGIGERAYLRGKVMKSFVLFILSTWKRSKRISISRSDATRRRMEGQEWAVQAAEAKDVAKVDNRI